MAIGFLSLSQMCGAALVAEWNFDDVGNLGNDSGTNSFNLATGGGFATPTYVEEGKVGGAASFVDDSGFTTPTNIYPNGDFTFSGWFKPSDTNFTTAITPLSRRAGFELYAAGGSWRARIWKHDLTSDVRVGPAIVADEWVHIAIWYNSTDVPDANGNYTGSFRLWVNGENLGGVNNAEYNANDTYDMHLGSKSTADYRGLMDEVKIYDTALSASEIRRLAGQPVAEWTFDVPGDLGNDTGVGYATPGSFDLLTGSGFTTPTYDATGRVGGAARFVDDSGFITPTNIYPNGSFSFAAWVKADDASITSLITPFSRRAGFEIYVAGGLWRSRVWKQDLTSDVKIGPAVVAGEWIHLALIYRKISGPDGSGNYTGTFRLWVNGENLGGVNNAEYNANDSYTMDLGSHSTIDFRGLMDEVRIYDYDLSQSEIFRLAYSPMASMRLV